MIHVGLIQLGPTLRPPARAFVDDLRSAAQRADTGKGTLDLVLVIGGSLGEPEFTGARRGRASRRMAICQMQVAIRSETAASDDVRRRTMPDVLEALALAEQWFRNEGIEFANPFPHPGTVSRLAGSYEPIRLVTLELPNRTGGYSLSWIESLEDRLHREVARANLGTLDGHEIGGDGAALFFEASDPGALAELLLQVADDAGIPAGTWIVRYDADGNEVRLPVHGGARAN
jgi:hypothetical protein